MKQIFKMFLSNLVPERRAVIMFAITVLYFSVIILINYLCYDFITSPGYALCVALLLTSLFWAFSMASFETYNQYKRLNNKK